ncbi:MAG: methyltransferase [Oscillospiraceae bacterium]|nr:methyltransferase [Oscillospiraceae bacterium]
MLKLEGIDENSLRRDKINDDLVIYQIKDGLLFSSDALILADFICGGRRFGAYKNAVELGTGSGVISLLLAKREKIKNIYAVEIQDIYVKLAEYNTEINNLADKIKIIKGDLRDCDNLYYNGEKITPHTFDMVFTNPPYIKYDGETPGEAGMLSSLEYKNIARREISCTVCGVMKAAARLLKNGGDFYIVYRPERLVGLFSAMLDNNITPKKIAFVYAGKSNEASLVLIKGKQGAGEGLAVENIFI